jgi:hypothetical protein
MTAEIENLVLKRLQTTRATLGEQGGPDRIEMRLGSLEQSQQTLFHADLVATNVRPDPIA